MLKQEKAKKKNHFQGLLSGPSRGYYLDQVCCNINMANLPQMIPPPPEIYVRDVF